jgi:MFS superfamily sulfate permease-like transporter
MRPLPTLPPWLSTLPGASQRRRALLVAAVALTVFLLRPLRPFLWLPGWVVGGLLIWAAVELLRWSWAPRRWR